MKWKNLVALTVLLLGSNVAYADTLNGPVGTACSGTTTAGTTMTGTQGWSTDPATGRGYWSCCQAGTSCVGRDKPKLVRDPSAEAPVTVGTQPARQTMSGRKPELEPKQTKP